MSVEIKKGVELAISLETLKKLIARRSKATSNSTNWDDNENSC